MRKKLSSLLIIMMVMVMVLAACSSNNNTAEPANTPAPTETNAPANTPDEPAAADEEKNDGIFPASDKSLNPKLALNRTDTIVVGMTSPKGIFSPFFWETAYDRYVVDAVFNSFLVLQGDGSYANQLAESVDVSEDGKKYTFKLKSGVTYSDGTPVTVNDYVFAMKVYHDKSYDGSTDILSENIVGGRDYYEGKTDEIAGLKVIDDLTIEIEVSEPTAYTKDSLGTVYFAPASYYGKDYKFGSLDSVKALNDKPIGAGPYVVKSFSPGQEVVLEANANYFAGAPKVKNVVYKTTTDETKLAMLQSGEIDMDMVSVNEDTVEELFAMGFLDVNIFPTNGYGYVAFNINQDRFKDTKVRQALTVGLNREEIVEAIYGKYADVINIPQSKESWAYTEEGIEKYEFDLEKAKSLLDEAGWAVGSDGIREKDGEKFKINFSATANNPVVDALIPVMINNYKELGIDLSSETLDFNAIMDKKDKGDFDMFFAAWGLTPEPDSTIYITDGAQNDTGYSNPKVDELTLKGKMELDPEKRKEIYKELYQEWNKDVPAILMYQRRDMWAINSRLVGFDITPYKNFVLSLHEVEITQ